MITVPAALLATVFGVVGSFLMSRASNYPAVANLAFGSAVVLMLAGGLLLIAFVAKHVAFPP